MDVRFSYAPTPHFGVKTTPYMGSWQQFGNFLKHISATSYLDSKGQTMQKGYICSLQLDPNIRTDANSAPRNWMAFDQDGHISTAQLMSLIEFFSDFDSYIYETRKSQLEAHRLRVILHTSRETTQAEREHLAPFITDATSVTTGWDPRTHGGQQPIYLRPIQSSIIEASGQCIDVDELLGIYPVPTPAAKQLISVAKFANPNTQHRHLSRVDAIDIFEFLNTHGFIAKANKNGYELICPFAQNHTNGSDHGAIYYPPSAENNFAGGFTCRHAHCAGRGIKHLFELI